MAEASSSQAAVPPNGARPEPSTLIASLTRFHGRSSELLDHYFSNQNGTAIVQSVGRLIRTFEDQQYRLQFAAADIVLYCYREGNNITSTPSTRSSWRTAQADMLKLLGRLSGTGVFSLNAARNLLRHRDEILLNLRISSLDDLDLGRIQPTMSIALLSSLAKASRGSSKEEFAAIISSCNSAWKKESKKKQKDGWGTKILDEVLRALSTVQSGERSRARGQLPRQIENLSTSSISVADTERGSKENGPEEEEEEEQEEEEQDEQEEEEQEERQSRDSQKNPRKRKQSRPSSQPRTKKVAPPVPAAAVAQSRKRSTEDRQTRASRRAEKNDEPLPSPSLFQPSAPASDQTNGTPPSPTHPSQTLKSVSPDLERSPSPSSPNPPRNADAKVIEPVPSPPQIISDEAQTPREVTGARSERVRSKHTEKEKDDLIQKLQRELVAQDVDFQRTKEEHAAKVSELERSNEDLKAKLDTATAKLRRMMEVIEEN
ncbi:uncharacterized protein JCM6883_001613 [Sporobolomyces salmoneus]|uniref:uncharacterized protein n=1 Tax=Sporobolomyces salmoneus TaxID=183962 RepID=UPI00318001D2